MKVTIKRGELKMLAVKANPKTYNRYKHKSYNNWEQTQLEMMKYVGKRKHSSQLTEKEKQSLLRRLRGVKKWDITKHALDRMEEKGIQATYDDIASTVWNCEIIEYKIDYNKVLKRCEERVVLRSKAVTNGEYNLNVVYNLHSKKIITVWLNHINDRHVTLNWSLYDPDMKVFGVR